MSRIVELHDDGPLVIQKDEMEGDTVAVCRCGLSGHWPMCDGSHSDVQDEADGELYRYQRDNGDLERGTVGSLEEGDADPRS